jgi:adenosine deaminase
MHGFLFDYFFPFSNYFSFIIEMSRLLEGTRDLNKCFGIFHAIHDMIRSKEIISRIMDEVLEDFMEDNVIYLELRTTPRDLPGESSATVVGSDMGTI